MSRIKNNPFEELFRAMTAQILAAAKEMAVGTVSSVSGNGIGITIDGDSSGAKKYTCNRAARFSSGDRVLCARESGTWVVICKIGAPGGPDAKTSAMTQAVGVDENGKLWTTPPGAYNLPTASTTQLGGIKTSEAYSSTKHTAKVAVNTSGVLYAEAYSLPTAGASTLGGVKPVAKTTAMTQDVGVDSAGKLYTTPPGAYDLPTASTMQLGGIKTSEAYSATKHTAKVAVNTSGVLYAEAYSLPTAGASTLGGVKPVAKTTAMTQDVGVDSAGKLYTTPPGAYDLPTASTTQLGGIKTSEAYSATKHTAKVAVNTSGVLYAEAYSLPTAGASTLGGVKPVAKTTAMTQDVGVDSAGKLYTTPPGAYDLPTASTSQLGGVKTSESYSSSKHTLTVAVNASGQLYAEKPSGGSAYVTELATSASSDTYNVKLTTNYQLIPSHNNSITRFALGTSSNPWGDAYLGYYGTVMIGNNSTTYAKLGFFGHTANVKQTLSLTSQNMGYSSVTAANYLVALNNLIGILREKHGLIG